MAAPVAPVPSFTGKLYHNTGTYGSPTWTEIKNIGDITLTDERNSQTAGLRSQGGFEVELIGLRKVSFATSGVYDPADTVQAALRSAYNSATPVELLILDGPSATVGSAGLRGMFNVSKFARQEPINSSMTVDMEFKLAYSANAPAAYTVPS